MLLERVGSANMNLTRRLVRNEIQNRNQVQQINKRKRFRVPSESIQLYNNCVGEKNTFT